MALKVLTSALYDSACLEDDCFEENFGDTFS